MSKQLTAKEIEDHVKKELDYLAEAQNARRAI